MWLQLKHWSAWWKSSSKAKTQQVEGDLVQLVVQLVAEAERSGWRWRWSYSSVFYTSTITSLFRSVIKLGRCTAFPSLQGACALSAPWLLFKCPQVPSRVLSCVTLLCYPTTRSGKGEWGLQGWRHQFHPRGSWYSGQPPQCCSRAGQETGYLPCLPPGLGGAGSCPPPVPAAVLGADAGQCSTLGEQDATRWYARWGSRWHPVIVVPPICPPDLLSFCHLSLHKKNTRIPNSSSCSGRYLEVF